MVDPNKCYCQKCLEVDDPNVSFTRMIVCRICGDKRCPKASDHRNTCQGIEEPKAMPPTPILEEISREARRERDRCVQIVWENRGKCASNQAALALMAVLNGAT